MTLVCSICKKPIIGGRFLVSSAPVICSECVLSLYEDYVDKEYENSLDFKERRDYMQKYIDSMRNLTDELRESLKDICNQIFDEEDEKNREAAKVFLVMASSLGGDVSSYYDEEYEHYGEYKVDDTSFLDKNVDIKGIISNVLKLVRGQDKAVLEIGRLIYRHVKRCEYNMEHKENPITTKENFLVVGPSGVGKTLTIDAYCRIFGIPYVVVDMTSLTKAGYIGSNIEDAFLRLIQVANGDIKLAQRGIMVLDEADKNARNESSRLGDPGGESMMFEMLKKLEGCDIDLGNGKTFNSSDTLFICMGVFPNLYDIRRERVIGRKSIGFSGDYSKEVKLGEFIADDFIKHGVPQEWIRRMPCIVELEALTKESYLDIFHNSSGSAFLQNKKLLEYMHGVKLEVTKDGEDYIVSTAMEYNMGAVGLNRCIVKLLKDVETKLIMSKEKISRVVIGKDGIISFS